jgi:hypothetical protein
MKNYVIRFREEDQKTVLDLVRNFSNDIQFGHIEGTEAGITIELEDEEADEMYSTLQREIAMAIDRSRNNYQRVVEP